MPAVPSFDLYATLRVEHSASSTAIRDAYRTLIRTHHPDVAGLTLEVTTEAQQINVAYDWLSDPQLRALYDQERGYSPGAWQAFSDHQQRQTTIDPWNADYGPRQSDALSFLRRVAALMPSEVQLLTIWHWTSVSGLRPYLPADLASYFNRLEQSINVVLGDGREPVRTMARVAIAAAGFEMIAGEWLAGELDSDKAVALRRGLTAGWHRATEIARYGDRQAEIEAMIERLHAMTPQEVRSFSRRASSYASGGVSGGLSDQATLRAIATDVEDAIPTARLDRSTVRTAQRAAANLLGIIALADGPSTHRAAWRRATDPRAPRRDRLSVWIVVAFLVAAAIVGYLFGGGRMAVPAVVLAIFLIQPVRWIGERALERMV
jgi:hypothetical protein